MPPYLRLQARKRPGYSRSIYSAMIPRPIQNYTQVSHKFPHTYRRALWILRWLEGGRAEGKQCLGAPFAAWLLWFFVGPRALIYALVTFEMSFLLVETTDYY